jgi:hypothetical protein
MSDGLGRTRPSSTRLALGLGWRKCAVQTTPFHMRNEGGNHIWLECMCTYKHKHININTLSLQALSVQALSQFGTDFTLITHLFPGRQRRHLKNKFTRESKINPQKVDNALHASADTDVTNYQVPSWFRRAAVGVIGGKGPCLCFLGDGGTM